ncbi:MAG TPA: NAD(P)-binding domain-containing protein [Candidatus Cybelea sp.]|nr:NAD(P)-binding domain-containing protein [Candidatus Cybelea sp.]
MIYLDEAQVRAVLRWEELIPAMEQALAEFSRGNVVQPVRAILTVEEGKRYLGVMPAVAPDVMGLKAVSFYPANEGSGVPTHQAIVLLFRTDNGEPLAVMDGRLITEMRTAAVSAAITKYLMPPPSKVLALLGSGVQAHSHLTALSTIHQFEEVRVWSRTPDHAAEFARRHGAVAMEAEAAVRGADVIVVATSSQGPVLRGAWLKEGAHVNAVGANRATWRELDDDAMRNVLLVDSREGALHESGDVILSGANIYAEIGEIFGGTKPACPTKTTIFKSLGIAAEDLAAARLVYEATSRN